MTLSVFLRIRLFCWGNHGQRDSFKRRIMNGRTTHILLRKWDALVAHERKTTVSMELHIASFAVGMVSTASFDVFIVIDRRLFR
jgi:hypothetical protein